MARIPYPICKDDLANAVMALIDAHNATQPEPEKAHILPSGYDLYSTFMSDMRPGKWPTPQLACARVQSAVVEAVCKWLAEMNRYAGVTHATIPMACDMLLKDARARLDEAK